MRTITAAVRDILFESDYELETLHQGFLNYSAYAQAIQTEVEARTWKTVRKGSIVVALARIAREIQTLPVLRPAVTIDELKIQSPLVDISYEKTEATIGKLRTIQSIVDTTNNRAVFVLTEGMSEITIVASAQLEQRILDHFSVAPKGHLRNLVGVSVAFNARFLSVPNTLYALIAKVASKKINVIELISTYTEMMFVIEEASQHTCVQALECFFPTKN